MKKILILFLFLTLSSCVVFQRPVCHSYPQASLRHKMKSPNLKKKVTTHRMLPIHMRNRDWFTYLKNYISNENRCCFSIKPNVLYVRGLSF